MQTFKLNNKIEIDCQSKSNRKGFQHVATLKLNGYEVLTTRTQYYNRTWERYQYESILRQLADRIEYKKILTKNELSLFRRFIKNPQRVEDDLKPLKRLGALTALSGIFGGTLKEKNDRKVRILKNQLGESFMLPDNWDDLSEEEKAKRLEGATAQLRK